MSMGQMIDAVHYHNSVGGMGFYYHKSLVFEERGQHAHDDMQISIPLFRRQRSTAVASGEVDVISASVEHSTNWGGAQELVVIHFDADFFEQALEERPAVLERGVRFSRRDRFIGDVGIGLRNELVGTGGLEGFLLSAIGTTLAGYLFKGASIWTDGDFAPSGTLAYHQTHKAIEIINGMIGRRASLAEISSELGMSQWHFSRQFRKVTGLSPYQFLLRARIERARSLLAKGHAISEVATMTGFSDQSHMHRHFIRLTGVTPGSILVNRASERTVLPAAR